MAKWSESKMSKAAAKVPSKSGYADTLTITADEFGIRVFTKDGAEVGTKPHDRALTCIAADIIKHSTGR